MRLSVFYEKLVDVVCGALAVETICVHLSIYLYSI